MGNEVFHVTIRDLFGDPLFRRAFLTFAVPLLGLVGWIIYRRANRVSLEDNALMVWLLDMIQQQKVQTLFFNSNVACINFKLIKNTKTTTTKYSDGTSTVTSTDSYIGELEPNNVLDFNQMGYKPIPRVELKQYRSQIYKRMQELICVRKVEIYHMKSFTPESLFVSRGRHVQDAWGDISWLIEYQNVGAKTPEITNGRYIG